MAISGVGAGMAAAGAFAVYVAVTNQPPTKALRSILKGSPSGVPNTPGPSGTALTSGQGSNPNDPGLVTAALKYVGRPYKWGGNFDPPSGGGDCSGLVYRAFHDLGLNTPRLTANMYPAWRGVHRNMGFPLPGDLLWWPGHIAIAVTANTMVEAPTFGIPVRIVNTRAGFTAYTPDYTYLFAQYAHAGL